MYATPPDRRGGYMYPFGGGGKNNLREGERESKREREPSTESGMQHCGIEYVPWRDTPLRQGIRT